MNNTESVSHVIALLGLANLQPGAGEEAILSTGWSGPDR